MNKRILVFILVLASSLTIMSTDIYAPSLAHLPGLLGTSAENVKLTMSLNMLAYALATLVHGPLSERFGRRPVLLWGMAGFTVFSLGCAVAQTVEQLIVARIFQGVAAAVEGVLVLAIIRDIFDEQDQVRVISIYGVATAVTPAVAPVIGGYIHVWFNWRMNFYLLFLLGLLVSVAIWYYLEESAKSRVARLKPGAIMADYVGLLVNPLYMKYCLIAGSSIGVFFAFITAGPFILINNHGLPTQHFGYFQAFLVVGFAIGAWFASHLIKRYSIDLLLTAGLVFLCVGGAIVLAVTWDANDTIINLALGMFLVALGDGLIFSTTPTLAMKASTGRTGSAAAMLVTLEMGIGALAALAVGVFHDGTAWPLGLTIGLLTATALMVALLIRK